MYRLGVVGAEEEAELFPVKLNELLFPVFSELELSPISWSESIGIVIWVFGVFFGSRGGVDFFFFLEGSLDLF